MEYLSGPSHQPSKRYIQVGSAVWLDPPNNFLKLNFDGVLKRNSGKERNGGVSRAYTSKIWRLYIINMGQTSNNVVEFQALEHALEMMIREWMMNVIVNDCYWIATLWHDRDI